MRFFDPPRIEVLPIRAGGKGYRLIEPLEYWSDIPEGGELIVIPPGFVSDGATVPRIFWPMFPPTGHYTAAAILHDWLCESRRFSWQETHRIFDEAMRDLGVGTWTRRSMFWAVWVFGPKWR